jgi:hypothetical protein
MRSAGGRLSSKKQKGHWSEESRGNADGEGGNGFMVLASSLPRCVDIVGGLVHFIPVEWLSATALLAHLTKRR